MANQCEICGKAPQFGNKVSHSHRKSRRRFNVNLQKIKADVKGEVKIVKVCTSCLKAGKVAKA